MRRILVASLITFFLPLCLPDDRASGQEADPKRRAPSSMGQIAGHRILKTLTEDNSALQVFSLNLVFQDRESNFWMGCDEMVQRFTPALDQWTTFTTDSMASPRGIHYESGAILPFPVDAICQSKDGRLWFASQRNTPNPAPYISSFDGKRWQKTVLRPANLKADYSLGMFSYQKGDVWVWMNDEIQHYNGKEWDSILVVSQRIKEKSFGLARGATEKDDNQSPIEQSSYRILCALEDGLGMIWLGTDAGVMSFNTRDKQFKLYTQPLVPFVNRIYADRSGRLWFANVLGQLFVYDQKVNLWTSYRLSDYLPPSQKTNPVQPVHISSFYQDESGHLLLATDKGLMVYTEAQHRWELYNAQKSDLLDDDIIQIMGDRQGRIWLLSIRGILVLAK